MVKTIVHDDKVYVEVDGLLTGLYKVCNDWTQLQMGPYRNEAAQRISGMIDMCKGLEDLHDIWKRKHGLR